MASRPDLIVQFSHFLAKETERQGYRDVEVRAYIWQSLNGREAQLLIDPSINLAAEPRTLAHKPWVMPLIEAIAIDPSEMGGNGLPGETEGE